MPTCNLSAMRLAMPLFLLVSGVAAADTPVVTTASAHRDGTGWRFEVTLSHPDTGWDHYADAWQIEAADGTVLGVRELAHPHVDEQPFTRSLGGVSLPEGTTEVVIRSRCSTDGWADQGFLLRLP
jgi:hypothetical protein